MIERLVWWIATTPFRVYAFVAFIYWVEARRGPSTWRPLAACEPDCANNLAEALALDELGVWT